jgi:hypothetical protein
MTARQEQAPEANSPDIGRSARNQAGHLDSLLLVSPFGGREAKALA